MKRIALLGGIGLVVLILIAEVCLRVFFGLGSPALVYADTHFGYAFQPNQACKRFGHQIDYDEAGLRSEPLRPMSGAAYRVLCVGGSVTNGGALIDQGDTYPYQLERILTGKGQTVQVLNASAGGWTLANEDGFLQDKGMFQARIAVLEVGTRELYQGPGSGAVAGSDPNLPEHKPATAITEAVGRYVLPRVLRRLGAGSSGEAQAAWTEDMMTPQNYERGLGTFKELVALVSRSGAKPIILLIPDRDESVAGSYRMDYRHDLSDLAASSNSQLVDMMPALHGELAAGREPFRDLINPKPEGNRFLAEAVAAGISQ